MKRVIQAPLTGPLNVRMDPAAMPNGHFRWRENFYSNGPGKLCRLFGFEKLLSTSSNYGNVDLHDQLLPLQTYQEGSGDDCVGDELVRSNGREPITFGYEYQPSSGARKLLVGTQSRLYVLNSVTRNYKLIGDGFGGPYDASGSVRFKATELADQVFLTNNFDEPQYWEPNFETSGCLQRAVKPIPDLQLIGLKKARIVVQYGSCVHFMNVEVEGRRYATRIYSSDLNNGLSHDPAKPDSIAAYTTLPNSDGEEILSAAPMGSEMVVYTDKAIYIGQATGDADNPFEYRQHYRASQDGSRCLFYPNTLVTINGSEQLYAGERELYVFTPFRSEPESVDWMTLFSGIVFQGAANYLPIGSQCHLPVASVNKNPDGTTDIYLSYPETGSSLNSKTIVFNKEREFATAMDCGFTMFTSYLPDYRPSFREFLLQNCACSVATLDSLGVDFAKEPYPINLCSGNSVGSIWTDVPGTTYGIISEDFSVSAADDVSLCAKLNGVFLEYYCRECRSGRLLVGAYSGDYCLKQIGTSYSREICTNVTGSGITVDDYYHSFDGVYTTSGYYSLLRSGPTNYGIKDLKKFLTKFILSLQADDQIDPCAIQMRVGYSQGPRDPNDSGIVWSQPSRCYLENAETMSDADYAAQGLIPPEGLVFAVSGSGMWLYWELKIGSLTTQSDLDSALIPAKGGSACFSQLVSQVGTGSQQVLV